MLFGNRKNKLEKSNSPGDDCISSVEDESGFAALNFFQEVRLPIVNSTMLDEVSTKDALLWNMLHNSSLNFSIGQQESLTDTTFNSEEPIHKKFTTSKDVKL